MDLKTGDERPANELLQPFREERMTFRIGDLVVRLCKKIRVFKVYDR